MNAITPATSFDFSALERADLRPSTRIKYRKALERFTLAAVPLDGLAEYATGLKTSERAFLKAALAIVSADGLNRVKSGATPENIGAVQALVYRAEAMNKAIHVKASIGNKRHNYLTQDQVRKLTALPKPASRDWIVLALLLGAGLRREELTALLFSDIEDIGERTVVHVRSGKGGKVRSVPISPVLAKHLSSWRQVCKSDRVVDISAVRIFQLVRKYGKKIGKPGLAPHDLRRTYATLGYQATKDIAQISVLLGHSSVKTTQRYLNLDVNMETTASDFVPLSGD